MGKHQEWAKLDHFIIRERTTEARAAESRLRAGALADGGVLGSLDSLVVEGSSLKV